ncbi:MAG TPA: molybdenum cofactor biosynthesis protein MoaE [Vicinamibacterales bacterium]
MAQVAVTSEPLDLHAMIRELVRLKPDTTYEGLKPDTTYDEPAHGRPGDGAIATFTGLVRDHNQGRRVRFLEYEAYEPLALRALARIVDEAQAAWPAVRLAMQHRIGRLEVGEGSIIVAAMSPHRADAFAACRYAIERVKQIVPIWKREHFEGGEVWLEGATADPDDETARRAAYRTACA